MPSTDDPTIAPPARQFQIGVVIVAYMSGELLSECISSVLMDAMVTSVVVVDNSSEMESRNIVDKLAATDSRLRYIDPRANLGFAAGCNVGVANLQLWTHVFFVNPDVQLAQPLSLLIDRLELSSQKIVAGRLISQIDQCSVNARPIVSIRREVKKAWLGGRAYRLQWPIDGERQTDRPFAVGQVDGALLGMSAETHSHLGGFDEQFELYYEDVDICARAESFGGCLFVPEVWGLHVGGASSSTVPELTYCLRGISRARYIRRHFGQSPATALAILFVAFIEFVARTSTNQAEGVSARIKAVSLQLREVMRPGSVMLLRR